MLALSLMMLAPEASAASLDLIEVGGAWGTPAATNPSAIWWNPAGLAAGGGTQFLVEGAPTFAKVDVQRNNPDYGDLDPTFFAGGYPSEYDYGGRETIHSTGIVPFVGVSSDLTIDGLGVGLGMFIPIARGGESDQAWGANRYSLRAADIRLIQFAGAASYQIADRVALGASLSFWSNSYFSDVDTQTYTDLAHGIAEELGDPVPPPSFQDGYIETQEYTSSSQFRVTDTGLTFGGGIYVTPLGNDKLGISVAYNHGFRIENEGTVDLKFQCPPDYDFISRFAAEGRGLCNVDLKGKGNIGYTLPSRVHMGVVVRPIDRLRAEVFGAYVPWSVFTDYDISAKIKPSEIDVDDPEVAETTAEDVSVTKQWARDNRNAFFVGLDSKVKVHRFLGLGGRVIYDSGAVPDEMVGSNNFDAPTVMVSGLVFGVPINQLAIGLSVGRYFLAERVNNNSKYGVTLDQDAIDPRYFYPSTSGTYAGGITRIGINVKGRFGPDVPKL